MGPPGGAQKQGRLPAGFSIRARCPVGRLDTDIPSSEGTGGEERGGVEGGC